MPQTDRQEVYSAINRERDYQEAKWSRPAHNHTVTEYLVYIQHQLDLARTKVSTMEDDGDARAELRKIAALCVSAMEEHGIVHRGGFPVQPANTLESLRASSKAWDDHWAGGPE